MGWSMEKIADALGVELDAVCYFMRKNGLKRRLIGAVLYWAEGGKRSKVVDFTNSEPEMCQLFMKFLREVCGINESKLRVYLYCHENQDVDQLMRFWSNGLRIPRSQFTKPYIRKRDVLTTNPRDERMHYGLVHIRYGDLKLLNLIKYWIQEITKGRYRSGQTGQTVKGSL